MAHKPKAACERRWRSIRLEGSRPLSLCLLLGLFLPLPPPDGQPLARVPSQPSCCSLCGPGRMPLFICWTPLPFDSPLPSVSADLCVLGIQLEERTERVTGAPNPTSAPPSTPGGAAGGVVPACHAGPALCWALWGLAAWWRGWGGTLQMGPEVMLVNVTSLGRVQPPPPTQNPVCGRGERGVGGRLALARSGWPPWHIAVVWETMA